VISDAQKAASAKRREDNRARGADRPYPRVRARPIYPGTRFKLTRRCHERRMFLSTGRTPDEIKNFFGYALGRSLSLYTVDFHAGNQMGDHHHIDATDVLGNRPDFKNSFHSTLARGLNAKRGRFDSFWSGGGSCDTCQPTDEKALMDLVYTDTNPVKAGLVKWGHRWPGFTTYGWRFGETRVFKRPDWFFDPDNPDNPEEVRVTRIRPKIFMDLSDAELFDLLMQKIRERERQIHEEMRKANHRFMGEKKLSRQHWNASAKSFEERFQVVPKVAASTTWKRLAQLQRDRDWERQYADARAAQARGETPLYPYGTYLMRLRCGVQVAQGPP
jgi:putative transposase